MLRSQIVVCFAISLAVSAIAREESKTEGPRSSGAGAMQGGKTVPNRDLQSSPSVIGDLLALDPGVGLIYNNPGNVYANRFRPMKPYIPVKEVGYSGDRRKMPFVSDVGGAAFDVGLYYNNYKAFKPSPPDDGQGHGFFTPFTGTPDSHPGGSFKGHDSHNAKGYQGDLYRHGSLKHGDRRPKGLRGYYQGLEGDKGSPLYRLGGFPYNGFEGFRADNNYGYGDHAYGLGGAHGCGCSPLPLHRHQGNDGYHQHYHHGRK